MAVPRRVLRNVICQLHTPNHLRGRTTGADVTRDLRPTVLAGLLLGLLLACGEKEPAEDGAPSPPAPEPARPQPVTLVFASFATTQEAYEKRIIPEFQVHWRRSRRQEVVFRQSYRGSRTQTQAIAEGAEGYAADVAALSMAEDLDELVGKGLIQSDWRSAPHGGTVCRSVVLLAVPRGNPLEIRDWPDLVRPGLRILTPDPRTSGGARWNVCAVYGAALRGHAGSEARDAASAEAFLARVFANVVAFHPNARESSKAFQSGEGDVAITSESEVIRVQMFGHESERVIPSSTIRVDNPAAVVDAHAREHGVLDVARAFLEFLWTREAQEAFAFHGFRPVDESVTADREDQYPRPPDLWTVEDLGGWQTVSAEIFAPGGIADRALAAASAPR